MYTWPGWGRGFAKDSAAASALPERRGRGGRRLVEGSLNESLQFLLLLVAAMPITALHCQRTYVRKLATYVSRP